MRKHDIDFLEFRIKECKTADDCYVVFNEISSYLNDYNVACITYRTLFDKCIDKYHKIEAKNNERR